MKKNFLKRLSLACVVVMVLSAALTGCSGGKKGENPSDSVSETTGTAVTGGEIVVGIQQDIDSLDPHLAVAAGTDEILFNIFEGLVVPDENGNVIPAVAKEYTISDDGLTYTFKLRDGIKFSDGTLVTAEDVKYSIERCAGLLDGTPLVKALSIVSSVEIVDGSTINIVLSEANSEIIYYLTADIIPASSSETGEIIGTGPFKLDSYVPQEGIILSRNEYYWQEGLPYLDKVTFKIVASAESAMMELQAGSIDIYPYLTDDQANELSSTFDIKSNGSNVVQGLYLNNAAAPFDDVRVRQALSYAIDRDAINEFIFGGRGTVIGTSMVPGYDCYVDTGYEHDVKKAKELLTEAGYPDGFTMEITVPSNYQMHVDTAQVIVEQLKEAGITATIKKVDWSTWLEDVYKGRNFETTVCGIAGSLTPSYLLVRYQSTAKNNFVGYTNENFDTLYKKISTSLDSEEITEGYRQLQTMLHEDAASVYTVVPPVLIAMNKKIAGYRFYPIYVQDMKYVYWTE